LTWAPSLWCHEQHGRENEIVKAVGEDDAKACSRAARGRITTGVVAPDKRAGSRDVLRWWLAVMVGLCWRDQHHRAQERAKRPLQLVAVSHVVVVCGENEARSWRSVMNLVPASRPMYSTVSTMLPIPVRHGSLGMNSSNFSSWLEAKAKVRKLQPIAQGWSDV
jgi:hypothetical protein